MKMIALIISFFVPHDNTQLDYYTSDQGTLTVHCSCSWPAQDELDIGVEMGIEKIKWRRPKNTCLFCSRSSMI